MVVCEWMKYNWEELGLQHELAMLDGWIYICTTLIPLFYYVCALNIIVKSLAYYGHSKGLNPIVSPFYMAPPSKANAQSKWLGENATLDDFQLAQLEHICNFSKWKMRFWCKGVISKSLFMENTRVLFCIIACVFLMWKFYPIILRHTNFCASPLVNY